MVDDSVVCDRLAIVVLLKPGSAGFQWVAFQSGFSNELLYFTLKRIAKILFLPYIDGHKLKLNNIQLILNKLISSGLLVSVLLILT